MAISSFIGEGAVIAITIKAIDEISSTLKETEKGITGLSKKWEIGISAMVGGGIALIGIMGKLSQEAAIADDQIQAFNYTLGTEGPRILEQMQIATLNTIDKFSLMSIATTAVNRGIDKELLPTYTDFAQRLADSDPQFKNVTDTINQVTTAIATGRTATLARMGIMVNADKVNKKFADNLTEIQEAEEGIKFDPEKFELVSDIYLKNMTDIQKETAITEAITKEMKDRINELPVPTKDAADRMLELNSRFKEAKVTMGQELQPAFSEMLESIIPLIPKIVEFVNALTPFLTILIKIAGWIVYFAGEGLEAIKVSFEGWKLLVNDIIGVFQTLWGWIQKIIDFFDKGFGKIKDFAGNVSGKISGIFSSKKVGDAIIRPSGEIIETDPRDTIIATKNPGGITIYIDNIYGMNPEQVSRALKRELSTKISI